LITVEATAGCGIPRRRSPVAVGVRLAHWQGQAEFATGQSVHRAAPAT
jgi:hypothetical protein